MKVYSCPDTVKVPDFDDAFVNGRYDYKKDDANNAVFMADLKAELIRAGYTGPLTGEVLYFPYADGKAAYMVADAPRKTCLIHLPLGDAWSLPEWQTKGLTKAEVKKMIEADQRLAALFGGKN